VNDLLLILVWSWPLLLAGLAVLSPARWLVPLAPLPALVAALAVPVGTQVPLPWLLLGVELGLDDTGRMFLLFSALLWLVAGIYGAGSTSLGGTRYRVFFLMAMAGNLGLIVAGDMLSFYFGFTLMGLAACGLVVHTGTRRARRAARRYLVWTIAGELLLFVALVTLSLQHGGALVFSTLPSSPPSGFTVLLLIIGFGIKLALPGLHLWLPQAYAVTPAPAVAVLSGAMIKAGLLGWLRFLPPGHAALTGWGEALIVIGIAGIFYGAALGLLQQRPRLLLGYSSISKMGVLTAGMGAVLAWPAAAPALTAALTVYAAHHALVKGALFLGVGLLERGGLRLWLLAGLGLLALALAGAPLTSGALAKSALTSSLPDTAHGLLALFGAAAVATTLLMARFLFLVWRRRAGASAPYDTFTAGSWLALLAMIAGFPFLLSGTGSLSASPVPLLSGVLLALAAIRLSARLPGRSAQRRQYAAARRLVAQPARVLSRAMGTLQHAAGGAQSRWHSAWLALRTRLEAYPAARHPGSANADWLTVGMVWLALCGLLLITFVTAA
jgi:formate hydrogenlyase subunit 3/multisubunit Na+/H+ antiporter MnhD subunit